VQKPHATPIAALDNTWRKCAHVKVGWALPPVCALTWQAGHHVLAFDAQTRAPSQAVQQPSSASCRLTPPHTVTPCPERIRATAMSSGTGVTTYVPWFAVCTVVLEAVQWLQNATIASVPSFLS
jgi:hypothetical protein